MPRTTRPLGCNVSGCDELPPTSKEKALCHAFEKHFWPLISDTADDVVELQRHLGDDASASASIPDKVSKGTIQTILAMGILYFVRENNKVQNSTDTRVWFPLRKMGMNALGRHWSLGMGLNPASSGVFFRSHTGRNPLNCSISELLLSHSVHVANNSLSNHAQWKTNGLLHTILRLLNTYQPVSLSKKLFHFCKLGGPLRLEFELEELKEFLSSSQRPSGAPPAPPLKNAPQEAATSSQKSPAGDGEGTDSGRPKFLAHSLAERRQVLQDAFGKFGAFYEQQRRARVQPAAIEDEVTLESDEETDVAEDLPAAPRKRAHADEGEVEEESPRKRARTESNLANLQDQTISELRTKLSDISSASSLYMGERDDALAKLKEIEGQLRLQEASFDTACREKARLSQQLESLRRESTSSRALLQEELAKTKSDFEAANLQVTGAKHLFGKLSRKFDDLMSSLGLTANFPPKTHFLEKLDGKFELIKEAAVVLKQQQQNSESSEVARPSSELKETLETLETQNGEMASRIEALEDRLGETLQDLKKAQSLSSSRQDTIVDLKRLWLSRYQPVFCESEDAV